MSASPVHRQNTPTRCVTVLTRLLRHLNMGTLALVMFVALALLPNIRGKEAETKPSILVKTPKTEVVIKGGRRTIGDLDFAEKETLRRRVSDK